MARRKVSENQSVSAFLFQNPKQWRRKSAGQSKGGITMPKIGFGLIVTCNLPLVVNTAWKTSINLDLLPTSIYSSNLVGSVVFFS